MTGKISEDADTVLVGTEKFAVQRGGVNYGPFATSIAGWLASLAQTLSNKTIVDAVLTGNPVAPTPASTDNDTSVATTAFVKGAVAGSREKLFAPRTYFVNAAGGSNANNGLTAGAAFATLQKAVDTIVSNLDTAGFTCTIQAAGAFTAGASFASPWMGGGAIVVDGGGGSIAAATGNAISCTCVMGAPITVQNVTLSAVTGSAISNAGVGTINVLAGVTFGACPGGYHMYAQGGGAAVLAGFAGNNYSISGGATFHIAALQGGFIQARNLTITVTANVTFSQAYAMADRAGGLAVYSTTWSLGAFVVTGTRYVCTMLSYIVGTGGNVNYFPGTVAGAAPTNGAQYA